MAKIQLCVLLPLLLVSVFVFNHPVRCDDDDDDRHEIPTVDDDDRHEIPTDADDDDLHRGINSYRASLNLTALAKNNNADCLADEIAERFRNQPCPKTTGSNTISGTEPQFADFPDLLAKCHLNVSNIRDGTIMSACVPNHVADLVLTSFTKSQYSGKLSDTKYTGIGIGTEGDWVVVILTTSTAEGSIVPAVAPKNTATLVSEIDDDDDDLHRGINSYRASLNLPALLINGNAECLADEIAERFRNQPCTHTAGSNTTSGTEPQFADFPDLLAKCHSDVSSTKDGAIMPACVPNHVADLVLTSFTKSQYSGKLNDTKYTGIGIGTEDNWVVVVLTTSTVEGSILPAVAPKDTATGTAEGSILPAVAPKDTATSTAEGSVVPAVAPKDTATLVSDIDDDDHDDDDDDLHRGINSYRASLNLPALLINGNAECLADEIAERFRNQPCTHTAGSNTTSGTEPQFADFSDLLAKCHSDVSSTKDGAIMPACVPNHVADLVLTSFTKSQYSGKLNDSKYTGIGIGTDDNWVVVILTTSTAEGSFVPTVASKNTATLVSKMGLFSQLLFLMMSSVLLL